MENLIIILITCFVLFSAYIADVICSIVGLCSKRLNTKKSMLITTIACSSVLALIDLIFFIGIIVAEEIDLFDLLLLVPFFLARIGLFIPQIINYTKYKKIQPVYIEPAKPKRLSLLFGILIIVFGIISCMCVLFIFLLIITALFGAWTGDMGVKMEEYVFASGLTCVLSFVSAIVCTVLCIVFKVKENKMKQQNLMNRR
jgi:hypothetical protein